MEIAVGNGIFLDIPPAALLTDPYDAPEISDIPGMNGWVWCGDPQPYLRSVISLDANAGKTVRLRFVVASDAETGRLPHGWYVDDIKVQGCNTPMPDAIFAYGFDPLL